MFKINYGQIRKYDVANGIGVRVSAFVTGCDFNCYNCFNEEYQDFKYGTKWTEETTNKVVSMLKDKHIEGYTWIGGEPMMQVPEITQITRDIKSRVDKNIWIWSGFTYEQIISDPDRLDLLKECDVLVDGLFVESKKDLTLKFMGSANQRIINIQESIKQNKVILLNQL